tara:strand:+ start:903 stop:2072 length:1170 start_codon:yes stop_codon:yes gene_type:complete
VTRPSLTFISLTLILALSGCTSIPTSSKTNNIDIHEPSYIHAMVNDNENISNELRSEILLHLEELFQYKKNDPEFYRKINEYINSGYIKKKFISQTQQAIFNNKKISDIQLIDKSYKTSKQNKEYIVESILKNDVKFNIGFNNPDGDEIDNNLLDSNLLYFCNSYIRDQANMIENSIFKSSDSVDVLVVYTKSFEDYAINLKQAFPDAKFSLINDLNHEKHSQDILGIDKSLARKNKIQNLDQNIQIEHTPRERKDFKKVYFLMDYSSGKSIVPIFRSYLINNDFYSSSEILLGAINTKQLGDFNDLLLPSPKYFFKKIINNPTIESFHNEIKRGLIDDLLLVEKLKSANISKAYVLLNSGTINYKRNECIQRELVFWRIDQENISTLL